MATDHWQFAEPPNVAVIANRKIVLLDDWIAYVSHDSDNGGWQFHTNQSEPVTEEQAMVVSLQSIVALDASIIDIVDLPQGWHAWRASKNSAWQREEMPV